MSNGQQQFQVHVDQTKMNSTYANTVQSWQTQDEVVIDFGFNMPVRPPQDGQPGQMQFGVGSRVIMNWTTAKRVLERLAQHIQSYEQHFGEIKTNDQPQPPADGPSGAPLQ